MTDEPIMKLYALSIAAMQSGERTAVGVNTLVALLPEGVSAEEAGIQVARDVFPEKDGWSNHYATAAEITQGFPLEPYRLIWHLEKSE
jgi:hypothetical protein